MLLRRIEQLVRSLNDVELAHVSRDSALSAEVLDRIERLAEARGEYEALLAGFESEPSRTATLLAVAPTRLTDVQAALLPGEALLDYLVTPDRLIVFVVTRDDVRLAESPISAEDLSAKVRLTRELLREPDGEEALAADVLEALYDILIKPAARAGAIYEAERLVLVPHEVLAYLPFAALRDRTTGRYLAEDFSLMDVPSAAALAALRDRQESFAIAQGATSYAVAPFPRNLPATREETGAVGASLPGTDELLGRDATERRVRRALGENGVVHVASHAVMNPRNPMFSRLELRPDGDGSGEDDGWLEVHELLGLSIRSPLIFLSGCETGLGTAWSTDFLKGEDYATLARAFLYAGGQNVVATLWRLEDESAAIFAGLFYRALRGGTPADALVQAQRQLMAQPEYASPYYWATYRLTGAGI